LRLSQPVNTVRCEQVIVLSLFLVPTPHTHLLQSSGSRVGIVLCEERAFGTPSKACVDARLHKPLNLVSQSLDILSVI
jgi:hypothetical protein